MAKKYKGINWENIKTEYITGHISQRDLAAKHNVPYSTLRNRSVKEGWVGLREQHSSAVVANAQKKIGKKQSDLLAEEYNIACQFIKLLEKSLADETNFNEVDTGHFDTKAVLNAANALQKLMDIKRICKGHQTAQEKQQHELALKRLELEEKRINNSAGNSDEKEYHIIIDSDDVKRWSE